MSKKKEYEAVEAFKDETLSSGVVVRILPFSAKLFDNIQQRGLRKYPDPTPPKKIIKVVNGTEEIDDYSNAEYLAEKDRIEKERNNFTGTLIGEATLDMCCQVDLKAWQKQIERLKNYDDKVPEDSEDLRIWFLQNYAIRGRADYERVSTTALTLMAVGDGEVLKRIESFRSEMEGPTPNGTKASSSTEDIRMDLESPKA